MHITPSPWRNIFMQSTTLFSVRLEHKKRMQTKWLNQPTLTSVIPPLHHEIVEDQEEDKSASQSCK